MQWDTAPDKPAAVARNVTCQSLAPPSASLPSSTCKAQHCTFTLLQLTIKSFQPYWLWPNRQRHQRLVLAVVEGSEVVVDESQSQARLSLNVLVWNILSTCGVANPRKTLTPQIKLNKFAEVDTIFRQKPNILEFRMNGVTSQVKSPFLGCALTRLAR